MHILKLEVCCKNDCPQFIINTINDPIIKKNTSSLSFYMCVIFFPYSHYLLCILCYIPNSFSFKQLKNISVLYMIFLFLNFNNRLYFSGVRTGKSNTRIHICLFYSYPRDFNMDRALEIAHYLVIQVSSL